MWELLRGASLVTATIAMGLMAGLFYTFFFSIMPGLARSDDRTFVDAMQRINVAMLNGWFAMIFGGALVLTVVAGLLHLPAGSRAALPWIAGAVLLYVAALVITIALNVPLNNALNAAGEPDRITDLAAVRERFEATWVRWNVARTALSTAAFACLTWALVVYGRVSS